jgi:TatD DNase family protein
MIDAHNHLQDSRFKGDQDKVIAMMKSEGMTACVVNGTCEKDWPNVARLAECHPDFVVPSFGLHPWKVAERSPSWLETLKGFLDSHPGAGIGECGLDRWMKAPDLDDQHDVFRAQLALAKDLDRPATIHCLKAWGPLLDELLSLPSLPRFLLHSYGGSREVAHQCLKLGAWFSFSGYFLHPRKEATRAVFAELPIDRILVETDAPDMMPPEPKYQFGKLNHPANLPSIAGELAALCRCPVDTFSQNARQFFGLACRS